MLNFFLTNRSIGMILGIYTLILALTYTQTHALTHTHTLINNSG